MIIEIRKAGFVNKGAQLMLGAIKERILTAFPDAVLTITPTRNGSSAPLRKILENGFYPKASLFSWGLQLGDLAGLAPTNVREAYGVILDREVDVVIDAAGFAYSDQWGDSRARELAHSATRWRRQGTRVILMPQALGPFTGKRIRRAMSQAVKDVDLVMPRERTSYEYLEELTGERDNIRQFPDFTNLVEGILPRYFDQNKHRVCLVPNFRMVDKARGLQGKEYLPFMVRCARELVGRNAKPFLLVHEGAKDRWLAEQISAGVGGLPILVEEDPLKIKGVIGSSFAMIGSRYHALISALSQGIPSLATGWSHKYEELFGDYRFPDGMLAVNLRRDELASKIDRLLDETSNRELSNALLTESERLKALSNSMWEEVFSLIHASRAA